ncbi:hypothetical protein GJ633_08165 [Halorubrum sp. CBA1125]|uniref:hypothetical protein n=1 Tax=Halorubrum sp. CBA1125 TaxID=2668072 RepID=UPI0012E8B780|nr:hypothetical protein [Halorubrum sp. CBA1125]MUW14644.1 hypothetical protein [Halorubrum sp. CBA1125]
MSNKQQPSDDNGESEKTRYLRREDVPENAHISACGVVLRHDGETLGEIETPAERSGVATADPKGRDEEDGIEQTGDN